MLYFVNTHCCTLLSEIILLHNSLLEHHKDREGDELVTSLSLVALQNSVEDSVAVQKLEVPSEFTFLCHIDVYISTGSSVTFT